MLQRALTVLVIIIAIGGCIQTENSNNTDSLLYGVAGGSPGFGSVRFILAQNCSNCHTYHTMSEDQLKTEGVIVGGGDATQSKLYHRLKGSVGGSGPKNMPSNGALTAGDINDIKDWLSSVP